MFMIIRDCKGNGFNGYPRSSNQAEYLFPEESYFNQTYTELESWSYELMTGRTDCSQCSELTYPLAKTWAWHTEKHLSVLAYNVGTAGYSRHSLWKGFTYSDLGLFNITNFKTKPMCRSFSISNDLHRTHTQHLRKSILWVLSLQLMGKGCSHK